MRRFDWNARAADDDSCARHINARTPHQQKERAMRLPIAIATLALAITTALPAFAVTPSPISLSLRNAAATPIETVQQTTRQRRQARTYRGYNAYAAAPRARSGYNDRFDRYNNPWGHCVSGVTSGNSSAYPQWDVCGGR
jgi:hypothetical protein